MDTRTTPPRELAHLVGVVGQDPLAGFTTDTVEEELAYGMEQLAVPPDVMRKRVEETLDLLGIADLRNRPLGTLSGGQQRVAIGAVFTTHPRVLVLDEPTSALDPTAAEDVLATINRLVHDLAVTVLVAEHRLERVVHYADRLVYLPGSTSLFASALLTAGVGPWLPFQMLATSWVGLGAGLLPAWPRGRVEIAMLAGYGVVAAYVYGMLMNMWSWPYAVGLDTQLSYVAGDPLLDNLHRFVVFTVVTSTLGWDTGRALTNLVAIALAGPAVLAALRRTARRAAFDAPVVFTGSEQRGSVIRR